MRLEQQRKDEARREALRLANEEKKKLKAEAAKLRAHERELAEKEFRQTLVRFLFSLSRCFSLKFFILCLVAKEMLSFFVFCDLCLVAEKMWEKSFLNS